MPSSTSNKTAESKPFIQLFSLLRGEENKQKVLASIKKGISFTGTNAWILACAIVIASVGLNVGSTAVIIGAMLISPLMGPILGAGFALGTYDFELFKKSIINLAIATLISLIFSMLYFLISPIKSANSEILARTFPSLYDVIIAFFGGLVGIIAITHIDKGNAIPGVAIATALMPPICVAGYSIATANLMYFLGSIFLYIINCVFICLSTYIIVKFLEYPKKEQIDKKQSKRIERIITFIIIIIIVPSGYFAYQLYLQEKFNQNVDKFIKASFKDSYVQTQSNFKTQTIEVYPYLQFYNQEEIKQKSDSLRFYGLNNAKLIVKTDTTYIRKGLTSTLGAPLEKNSEKDIIIEQLKKQIKSNYYDNSDLQKEVNILFPTLENIAIANYKFSIQDSIYSVPSAIYLAKEPLKMGQETQLKNWLKARLKRDTMLLYFQHY